MKVTVIGCWGGYPAAEGATSAYLIEKDNFSLLVDAGSGALSQLQKYISIEALDAVLVSHYHHDHIADIGVLQYAKLVHYYVTGNDTVLPIYGHKEDEDGFSSLSHTYTEGVAYDPEASLEIGPFSITFFRTEHPVPCFGMRITDSETVIVYTADTSYMNLWSDFARNADLLITDCNYYAGQDGSKAGHMTSREGAIIAQEANAKTLILSHLPQFGDIKELAEEAKADFDGNIYLAHAGLEWKR